MGDNQSRKRQRDSSESFSGSSELKFKRCRSKSNGRENRNNRSSFSTSSGIEKETGKKKMFYCNLCRIEVRSEDHVKGTRHTDKMLEYAVRSQIIPDRTVFKIKVPKIILDNIECKASPLATTPKMCRQLNQILPAGAAKKECFALKERSIRVIEDTENYDDPMTQCKLTYFTVYDKEGNLVPFDDNLIEVGEDIFFSGYLNHITCEDPGIQEGVPVSDCGPIEGWWISGFDQDENSLVSFTTSLGEYYLMEPSDVYAPLMKDVQEKILVTKAVIEFLKESEDNENSEYEDLLSHIDGMDQIGRDTLVKHAEFVVNQVYSYDVAGDIDEEMMLVNSNCMKALMKLAGIKWFSLKKKLEAKKTRRAERRPFVKATVTNLVRELFEELFKDQLVGTEDDDLGKKYDDEDEVSLSEEEDCSDNSESEVIPTNIKKVRRSSKDYKWEGDGEKICDRTYFKAVTIGGNLRVSSGDTVLVSPEDPSILPYVAKIVNLYQYEGGDRDVMVHLEWFCRGTDTCIGEASDPTELFYTDGCDDEPLLSILQKCTVERNPVPDYAEWKKLGGTNPIPNATGDGQTFWVSLWYGQQHARFEYPKPLPKNTENSIDKCRTCIQRNERMLATVPKVGEEGKDGTYASLMWDYKLLKVGDCVYLEPGSVSFKIKQEVDKPTTDNPNSVNEDLYPEYWRKSSYIIGSNADTPDPFQIALIKTITKIDGEVRLTVQMFYRPEDTHQGKKAAESAALNMVYWNDEEATVPFKAVQGRCHIRYADSNITDQQLAEEGPDRWYFREMYNSRHKRLQKPPPSARKFGKTRMGGEGDERSIKTQEETATGISSFPPVPKKLRCLDVFAGCGGLSQGLHMAGVAETKWAVEKFQPEAHTFKLNNPDCIVFVEDCNLFLKNAMDGIKMNQCGQKIPQPGEVDLLVGGPPCQGFSGMNRFNHREYSQFKNSLVSTYLSYLEFYRPKYFILENVRNFASFKKSMVLRLCMRAMIKMGYQCTFGILQAGQFGVAQTRRRAILLAAAPGETLPLYPEPRHVFSPQACHLSVEIDDRKYFSNAKWINSAPYRTITVRDTLSDLPKINNGHSQVEMRYQKDPESQFQNKIRGDCRVLRDHVCKDMSPLAEARMDRIPLRPGSDWRDLPNSVVTLKDGTITGKLIYGYKNTKQGSHRRVVCSCSTGKKCNPSTKQKNTLIPWSLAHSASRNNQWAGLYGRVEMDGFFSTIVTKLDPMGKQGRVLHPEQSRVVSVRECARSQGFPDTYKFCGTVSDKYKQVGNAVAPPMAKFIGLEIFKAMANRNLKSECEINEENVIIID